MRLWGLVWGLERRKRNEQERNSYFPRDGTSRSYLFNLLPFKQCHHRGTSSVWRNRFLPIRRRGIFDLEGGKVKVMLHFILIFLCGLLAAGLFYFFFELDRFTVRFKVTFFVLDPRLWAKQRSFSQYLRWEEPVYNRDVVKWAEQMARHYIPIDLRKIMAGEEPAVVVKKEDGTPFFLEQKVKNGDGFVIYVVPF